LRAIIYDNGRTPLRVVGFELIDLTDDPKIRIEDSPAELQEQLRYLDKLLLEQHHSSLYMRRHVRIYDGTSLYLVRPSEKRFWTQSQARADADDAIVDWLSQPSGLEVEG
jgi:hypothetical protein